MPLVDQPFDETFVFNRDRVAVYRNAEGVVTPAGVDEPRFDHTADGRPRGLLIEGRPQYGQADQLAVQPGDWTAARGTVLHAWEDAAGVVQRRAWYSAPDPVGTVNSCLNVKGRIRLIAYVPQYLPNQGGFVVWRSESWGLGGILMAAPGVGLSVDSIAFMLEG